MPTIYLDHAASTPMRPEAIAAMQPYFAAIAANPSGGHRASQAAKTALEESRESVAECLAARPNEIVFTAGGSEADNLAVKGAAWAARDRGPGRGAGHGAGRGHGPGRVVTTGIEHKAVLGAAHRLAREGFDVVEVPATPEGCVDLGRLSGALDETVVVVSVMLVNNETGTVQPLDEVATLVHELAPHAVLHTDAVQAPQWLDLRTAARGADLVAISGHKFGGPKGVGTLVVREGVELVPLIEGGGHEWGLRAGTQNVAGIVAFSTALRIVDERRVDERRSIARRRDRLEAGLLAALPGAVVTGDTSRRVEGLLHVSFPGVEAETLLVALDQAGVCAASGSACSSGAVDPSHVLLSMGMPRDMALTAVRFSLGYASTDSDIDTAVPIIARCVEQLRVAAA